jgi:nucleoside-diphosphate-sugar epimerase
MKVLYLGGSGEISYSCVLESLTLGHEVAVFNRGRTDQVLPAGVRRVAGDLEDAAALARLAEERFDAVCQFVAFDEAQIERDRQAFEGRTGQYVFISSASVYSKPIDRFAVITERTPIVNPYWEYSRTKARMETTLRGWHAGGRLPVTVVRPSHTYRRRFPAALGGGDWTAERMLAGLPIVVHGDGASLWTLTHASDFARPFARLLGNPKAHGEAFHITGDGVHTWDEIMTTMGRVLGVVARLLHVSSDTLVRYEPSWKGPLHGDKAPSTLFDNAKARSVAGPFETTVSLEQGFASVAEHFRARRASAPPATDAKLDALFERIVREQGLA